MRHPHASLKLFVVCLSALAFLVYGNLPARGGRAAAAGGTDAALHVTVPRGIPAALWRKSIPADNPLTPEKVGLGRDLYFDKRLSADGTLSCATCHDPATAFTDPHPLAVGVRGQTGTRNAPTVLNAMFSDTQFWDGRARTLEEQAMQPLVNPSEMGMSSHDAVVARVEAVADYRQKFQKVFGGGITIDAIVKAIASYERTQLSGNSPFDRFMTGDASALTEAQKRGWDLFQHKAQCITCHSFSASSPFFTDFRFHNTGVATGRRDFAELLRLARRPSGAARRREPAPDLASHQSGISELGRYLVTGQPKDVGAFKTPTLRDVELTTPYMHDGSEKTLLDVVRFYNRGGVKNPYLDRRIRPLGLTDGETNDLVEFLRALTGDDVLRQAQSTTPQNRTPIP